MDYIGFNGSATSFNLLADLRFKDADGSHYVGFKAPSAVGANLVWTLPASEGTGDRVLKTDGNGNLNFALITNVYIDSNAAIAGTKISPDFGSQNIVTTGTADTGALGVTGNIAVSGTVDGVDIAARDTLFGGLTSSSGVLTDGVSATTQTSSDNTTKVATTAYVTTAVNNLINGAPAALDTLNELAAAMNDDAAFSTTVTNSLATKLALAGGQMTGNITFSGSQTVDGRDLSVDGAKLDGGIMLADGDKGDITVSNSGATFTIDSGVVTTAKIADDAITTAKLAADAVTAAELSNNIVDNHKLTANAVITSKIADDAVTSAKIADGTIVNANINASAAIAGSKISPDFGSQNITTTGNFGAASVNITDNSPSLIFTDSSNDSDFRLRVQSGVFKIRDDTNSVNRLEINSTGVVTIPGNTDFSAGIDVTGNITVTGTVDGVDIATRDTLFGGLTASSGVLTDGVTATTQSASDSTTKVATTAFTQSAIGNATIAGSQISTNAIDTTKIADDAVTSDKIADDAVGADQLASNSVVSASIVNGAIVNADVNGSAAIAGTKISPDFGSQNIVTTGDFNSGSVTITGGSPAITFTDSNNDPDYYIQNNNGALRIYDATNSAERLVVNTDGHVDVTGNLDVGSGLDVTGDTTVTGNMGVGTTSPVAKVHIAGSNYASVGGGFDSGVVLALTRNNTVSQTAGLALNSGTSGASFIHFGDADDADLGEIKYLHSDNSMSLILSGTDRLKINSSGLELTGNTTIAGSITATGASSTLELNGGIISLKNQGAQSEVRLYCESSNAHYAAVQAPAHSVFSGNVTLTLPGAAGNQSLVGTTETQTLTNKTLTSAVLNTGVSGSAILDEDNMASNSATQLATQQSIKAYVDANAGGGGGSPGGSNTQVQFNNSGSFGGSSNLTFDGTNLTVGGTITATSAASSANGIRKITASTSAPSGGSDGDVWIKYTA